MKYDFIVIGGGLGGLVSAIILGMEKKKVLVLEQHNKPGGYLHSFYRKGHRFETGFHFAPALDEDQILALYWKYLGIYDTLELVPYDKNHLHSLVFPDRTFKMPCGFDNLEEMLKSTFPGESPAISVYFDKMKEIKHYFSYFNRDHREDPRGKRQSFEISIKEYLDSLGMSNTLQTLLTSHSFLYGVPPSQTPLGIHAIVFNAVYSSVYDLKGGGDGLCSALTRRIGELGGVIQYKKKVTVIDTEDKKIKGVKTEDGAYYKTEQIVCNINPQSALDLFQEKVFRKIYTGRIKDMENSLSHFGLYCTVEKDMGEVKHDVFSFPSYDIEGLYKNPASAPTGNFFLYVTFPTARTGTSGGQHIMETISADSWNNYRSWEKSSFGKRPADYKAFKEQIKEKVLDKTYTLFPDLKGKLGIVEASTPLTNYHFTRSPEGSIYALQHTMEQVRSPVKARTKLPGFYFTGQSLLFPGILGVTITAFVTCSAILGTDYLFKRIDRQVR